MRANVSKWTREENEEWSHLGIIRRNTVKCALPHSLLCAAKQFAIVAFFWSGHPYRNLSGGGARECVANESFCASARSYAHNRHWQEIGWIWRHGRGARLTTQQAELVGALTRWCRRAFDHVNPNKSPYLSTLKQASAAAQTTIWMGTWAPICILLNSAGSGVLISPTNSLSNFACRFRCCCCCHLFEEAPPPMEQRGSEWERKTRQKTRAFTQWKSHRLLSIQISLLASPSPSPSPSTYHYSELVARHNNSRLQPTTYYIYVCHILHVHWWTLEAKFTNYYCYLYYQWPAPIVY